MLESADECMDALVLQQRLHQQPLGSGLLTDERGKELLLLLTEVPDGLRGEEANEVGGGLATCGVRTVRRLP